MAKPAKPAAKKEEPAAAPPKNKKKLILIGALSVLLAGGGAGWYFMKAKNAAHDEAPKAEVRADPIFIALDTFTVNLQHEEADQYLQINFALKVLDPELVEKIKAVMPEIRSKLNLLLSSKRPSEISTVDGKKKLAEQIAAETNKVLGFRNAPVAAPAAPEPASSPDAVAAEGTPEAAAAPEGASAPDAAAEHPAEETPKPAAPAKKGVVDVLFTSFIIQ